MTDTHYLVASIALAWLMILSASMIRARAWTVKGWLFAFSNRDDAPEPTPLSERADRAAKNMLENLLLFGAALAAAWHASGSAEAITLGAAVFFWARLVYWVVYLAGIPYLRTAIWTVGVVGIGIVGAQAF